MQKTNFIVQGWIILLSILISACDNQKELPPPNILWIVSEDNSPFLGCYGDSLATTPNLDQLASEGILYTKAYANAPVCAPNRSTLITGMYVTTLGTENMRSKYSIPDFVKFYPTYLRQAGYYTTNNAKEDYNTNSQQPKAWDESSKTATYKNRKEGQPFFHVQNIHDTHESRLHRDSIARYHDPAKMNIPPYLPDKPTVRNDYAVYYDRMKDMDREVGKILEDLEKEGLAENTIVFYYSDHGGPLPRSKRFLFESGLKVPLIVRIPEKYQHLAPQQMGTRSDRLVSFIDLAPTLINLAGVDIPEHMQGLPFLGQNIPEPHPYSYAARARMDERLDFSRSITNGKYRYTRNYMPHRPYGQYLATLWKAPSMQSWEEEYANGTLNEVQATFFKSKPPEELYDVINDPHNVKNLAENEQYVAIQNELSDALDQWQIDQEDAGFFPEGLLSQMEVIYDDKQNAFDVEKSMIMAKKASSGNKDNLNDFITALNHGSTLEQYWAATGLVILGEDAQAAKPDLLKALQVESSVVRIAAAEALFYLGSIDEVVNQLIEELDNDNLMIRVQALNVLELMGEDARPALAKIKAKMTPKEQRTYDNRLMWRIYEKLEKS